MSLKKSSPKKFISFLLPFCLLSLAFLIFLFFADVYARQFGRMISNRLAPQIKVERVFIVPAKGIELSGVPLGLGSAQAIFAKSVGLRYSLREVFRKKIFIGKITLREVSIDVPNDGGESFHAFRTFLSAFDSARHPGVELRKNFDGRDASALPEGF